MSRNEYITKLDIKKTCKLRQAYEMNCRDCICLEKCNNELKYHSKERQKLVISLLEKR